MLYEDTDVLLVPKPVSRISSAWKFQVETGKLKQNCNKVYFKVGQKYITASRYNTPCINLLWLRDILLQKDEAMNEGWKQQKYDINHSHESKESFSNKWNRFYEKLSYDSNHK